MKLCECGCGRPAPIAAYTNKRLGYVRGGPKRFIWGHSARIIHAALKHGATAQGAAPPEYRAYVDARYRCTNPKSKTWSQFGGRGIEFRFTSLEQFFAAIGPRPTPAHQLGRFDNNGHYETGNVRWVSRKEQAANRRPRRPAAAPLLLTERSLAAASQQP
ncbi:MAG: hypothetical protein ACE14M_11005 [Terriglobales bacterium]